MIRVTNVMYPGADNTKLKEYFAERPLVATIMFGVLALLYVGGAFYAFSIKSPFYGWAMAVLAVIHFVESMRRLSKVPVKQ